MDDSGKCMTGCLAGIERDKGMMGFTLDCIGDGFQKGQWRFEPYQNGMNVRDPAGTVHRWFPHDQANDRFALPSFWRSIKNIGFTTDKGAVLQFAPDRRAVTAVKTYLDDAVASLGPEAVQRLGRKGWLNFLGGLGAILLAFLVLILFYRILEMKNRHGAMALAAVILAGIAETAWGVSLLFRARRVRRKLQASLVGPAGDPERPSQSGQKA
jgi:hypothetical protein